MTTRRVDQLRGDAHSIAGLAHAAFEHVADAEFTADLTYIDGFALVAERRVARDDEQPMCLGQCRDDVFRDAVGEELLLIITAHVLECENRDRRLVRKRRCGRGLSPYNGFGLRREHAGCRANLERVDPDWID